jgi:hypothetical protein
MNVQLIRLRERIPKARQNADSGDQRKKAKQPKAESAAGLVVHTTILPDRDSA